MFVKTQFDKIVNLAEFEKIKMEWSVKQDSGNTLHIISAVSEEYSYRPRMGGSVEETDEVPMRTYKSETLAQFRKDMTEKAEEAYNELFTALFQGQTAFDMTDYLDIKQTPNPREDGKQAKNEDCEENEHSGDWRDYA